ncbi:hypothetical protein [Streptosporangium sp. NPDC002607]
MRVRRVVVRVEMPACDPARARALAVAALARVAAGTPGPGPGRIAHLQVRVDAAASDRVLAARIARTIAAAITERAGR